MKKNQDVCGEDIRQFFAKVEPTRLIEYMNGFDNYDSAPPSHSTLMVKQVYNNEKDEDYYLIWCCFLTANFFRGSNNLSLKAFEVFLNNCKKDNLYFDQLPEKNQISEQMLPWIKSFRFKNEIISVIEQIVEKGDSSGKSFVKNLFQKVAEIKWEIPGIHGLYFDIIRSLMSYKYIAGKIANAIISEISYELWLLKQHEGEGDKKFRSIIEKDWVRNLAIASLFNCMMDTHVKGFFVENLLIKSPEHSFLILMGEDVPKETIREYFFGENRQFGWIDEEKKNKIIQNYHSYIGANFIEKMIWVVNAIVSETKKEKRPELWEKYSFFKDDEAKRLFIRRSLI